MGAITIALVVLLVAVIVGFVAFLTLYHIRQRRNGNARGSILPSSLSGLFGGGGSGSSRSERETGTRFAALDVDEAWDAHVDEEMGYDSVRMKDHGSNNRETLTHDELDERYDAIMDGGEGESSNPFGSGASRVDDSKRKSAFKESI